MDIITGRKLVKGMKIGGVLHQDFDLRAPLVEDMLEAEKTADARMIHTFNVELLSRVVTRVGTFTGPFTPNMFKSLSRADYNVFVSALIDVDALGEGESGAEQTSSAAS